MMIVKSITLILSKTYIIFNVDFIIDWPIRKIKKKKNKLS